MFGTRIKLSPNYKYNSLEDDQILNRKRLIFLDDVSAEENHLYIKDVFFRTINKAVEQYGNNMISESPITPVTVVNLSAIKGTIHRNTSSLIKQNHNVYHGVVFDSINNINYNSNISFEHYNFSTLVDENCSGTPGENNLCESKTFFNHYGCQTNFAYMYDGRQVLFPFPQYYDELDQVRTTDNDVDDYTQIYYDAINSDSMSFKQMTLGDLIDKSTYIYKRKIYIESEQFAVTDGGCMDFLDNDFGDIWRETIFNVITDLQVSMDHNSINEISLILAGKYGFNVINMRRLFEMHVSYERIAMLSMYDDIRVANESIVDMDFSLIINISSMTHAHVRVIKNDKIINTLNENKSDSYNLTTDIIKPSVINTFEYNFFDHI